MRLLVSTLVTVATAILALAALATVVPAPTRSLMPLSVGAPELSAPLLALTLIAAAAAWAAGGRVRVALAVLVPAALLLARPLWQASHAGQMVDERLYPPAARGGQTRLVFQTAPLRAAPFRLLDTFTGIAIGAEPRVAQEVFASPSGVDLTVRIYGPVVAARPQPIVVQIYGGAWQRGSPADDPHLARYLAAHGYIVYAVDYRHAPRWPWPAQLDDLRTAMIWIEGHARAHGGDPSRIALLGRSAGAHLALMAAYSGISSSVRCVVSLYGPVDLLRGYAEVPRPDPIGVRETVEALMGGPPSRLEDAYRQASPITLARRPQPATLQIIGARDHVVLPVFPASLDAALREAGNRSVLIELPWADHAFDAIPSGPSAQISTYAIERFLLEMMEP